MLKVMRHRLFFMPSTTTPRQPTPEITQNLRNSLRLHYGLFSDDDEAGSHRRRDTLQDMLLRLPPEIAAYIFSFLNQHDMCNLSLVCLRWRAIATDPYFWHWHDLNLSEVTDSLRLTLSVVQQSRFQFVKNLKLGNVMFSHSSANQISMVDEASLVAQISPPRPRKKKRRTSNGKKYPPVLVDPIILFTKVMACCPKLESLDLSLCHNITNIVLQQITRSACSSSIRCLQFSCYMENGNNITDTGLMHLSMYCPAIQQLHLPWACEITDIGLDHLGRGCRGLTSFDIMGNKRITDDGIYDLVRGCSALKYLNLSGCENITDEALRHISTSCKGLKCLQLLSCKKITDKGLQFLARGCKNLRSLHLYKCNGVTDQGLRYLAQGCQQLYCLELYSCKRITDAGLIALGEGCRKITELDLSGCFCVTDNGVSRLLEGCVNLNRFCFYGCDRISPEMVSILQSKQNIAINYKQ